MRLVLLWIILFYQRCLSPWMPASCRYVPSCSQYMFEAIKIHGAARGFWLGLKRIGRCNPLGSHGYDPVPAKPGLPEPLEPESKVKEISDRVPR